MREKVGAAASRCKKICGAHIQLAVRIVTLHMSEATSASNHSPAKESAGIKIGMSRRRPHTNGLLIPQLVLLVSARRRIVILIITDPTVDLANGGELKTQKLAYKC